MSRFMSCCSRRGENDARRVQTLKKSVIGDSIRHVFLDSRFNSFAAARRVHYFLAVSRFESTQILLLGGGEWGL